MDYKDFVNRALEQYKKYEFEEYENGAMAIGRAKFIAPLAYLHRLFPALNDTQILWMEKELNVRLPQSLRLFYKCFNGVSLFNTSLNIYGLRLNFNRSTNIAVGQPFDIVSVNRYEKPTEVDDSLLIIGGYSWNGSRLMININDGHLHYCERDSSISLIEWNSLDEMLEEELNRLIEMHTIDGKNIPFRPTVPTGGYDELDLLVENARKAARKPYWWNDQMN